MMTLQCWLHVVPREQREQFMHSKLWRSYMDEWIWGLAVVDEEIVESTYEQLNEFEQDILLELLKEGLLLKPQHLDTLVHILIRRLGRPLQQCKQALQLLLEAGIVLAFQDPWRGLVLWMPLPILNNWRKKLCVPLSIPHEELQDRQINDSTAISLEHGRYEHELSLPVQLTMFLQQIHNMPLQVTKQGQLSKASTKQLQKRLKLLDERTETELAWKNLMQGSGAIVEFFLELAFNLGIAIQKENQIRLVYGKLKEWLALPQSRQQDILWQWLIQQLVLSDLPVDAILVMLDSKQDNYWHAYRMPAEAVSSLLELLELCADCGFLSYSSSPDKGILYIRRSTVAQPEHQLHIQQNGELLLLPGIMPYVLWSGLEIAEVVSAQEVVSLRLTLKSLQQARHSTDRIREWLQGHTNNQLPIMVEQLLLMAEDARSVSNSTLNNESGNNANADQEEIDLLSMSEVQDGWFEMCSFSGWGVYCRHPLGQLMDTPLADYSALREYFNQEAKARASIPRSWQSELRSYHLSTKQQIVEAAIEQGLCLNVTTSSGSCKLVPLLLEYDSEESILQALSYKVPESKRPPLRIELKAIEAIQLAMGQ